MCTIVAGFGKTLSPLNQARLISLFPCVSPCTTRLARNMGRSLLMEALASPRGYEKLPDLSPVVQLLSPPVGSGAHFDVAGNADKEGYHDELTSRVSLLSRVLSDIPEYTSLEVQAAKEQAAKEKALKEAGATPADEAQQGEHQDGEKEKEEQASIIEQVRTQLEMLHGKIGETPPFVCPKLYSRHFSGYPCRAPRPFAREGSHTAIEPARALPAHRRSEVRLQVRQVSDHQCLFPCSLLKYRASVYATSYIASSLCSRQVSLALG